MDLEPFLLDLDALILYVFVRFPSLMCHLSSHTTLKSVVHLGYSKIFLTIITICEEIFTFYY